MAEKCPKCGSESVGEVYDHIAKRWAVNCLSCGNWWYSKERGPPERVGLKAVAPKRRWRVGVVSVALVVVAIAVIAETNPRVKEWIDDKVISPIRSFFVRLVRGGEKPAEEGEEEEYLPIERPIKGLTYAINARDAEEAYGLFSAGVRAEHPKAELEDFMLRCEASDFEISAMEAEEAELMGDKAILKVEIAFAIGGESRARGEYSLGS